MCGSSIDEASEPIGSLAEIERQLFRLILHSECQLHAEQTPNNFYMPRGELTHDKLAAHLRGDITVGVQLVHPHTNLAKAGCLDFDGRPDDLDRTLAIAERAHQWAEDNGVPMYMEFSGYNGWHLWVFVDDPGLPPSILRSALKHIAESAGCGYVKAFPYFDDAKVRFMGWMKLPPGLHRYGGGWAGFVGRKIAWKQGRPRVPRQQARLLRGMQRVDPHRIEALVPSEPPPVQESRKADHSGLPSLGHRQAGAAPRHSVTLTIAGLEARIDYHGEVEQRIPAEYQPFIGGDSRQEPDYHLRIHYDADCVPWDFIKGESSLEPVFDGGMAWGLLRKAQTVYLLPYEERQGHLDRSITALHPDFSYGDVYIPCAAHKYRGKYPLPQSVDQVIWMSTLPAKDGLMLRGCAVDDRGDGLLFVGHSERGGTAVAELLKHHDGISLLSDGQVIVRETEGAVRLYGTPWPSALRETGAGGIPLKTIFFLAHAKENHVVRQRPDECVAQMMQAISAPFWSGSCMDKVLLVLDRILRSADIYHFGFVPTPEVVPFVRSVR